MQQITVQKSCSSSIGSAGCNRNKLEFASLCGGVLVVENIDCCAYELVLHKCDRAGHQFIR